jgi:hypothetical protein
MWLCLRKTIVNTYVRMKDINREFVLEIFIRNEDSPKYYNKRCLNSKFLKKKNSYTHSKTQILVNVYGSYPTSLNW